MDRGIEQQILETFDIPQGILYSICYNVTIADEGARYTEKELRFKCHRATLTETQSGTGADALHNFAAWDPLSCSTTIDLRWN